MIPVVVTAGETLSGIAAQYGTTYQAIVSDTPGISDPNLIYAGETVNVPSDGGTVSVTPTTPAWTPPAESAPVQSQSTPVQSESAPVQSTPSAGSSSGSLSDIPGVPSSFAACVAYRESTDGTNQAYNGGVYGIIDASGINVNGQSVAAQKAAFSKLYAEDGTAPWSSDGCAG